MAQERRVAAVVLPELLCELAQPTLVAQSKQGQRRRVPPMGVVLVETRREEGEPIKSNAPLDAVNSVAKRFGVREGQSIAEGCALVAQLVVREVTRREVERALGRIAEAALAFGATVSLAVPDTVWVDISGGSHLFGGEQNLAVELASMVRALGHTARVAIASGPQFAQAFARWAPRLGEQGGVRVVASSDTRRAFGELPVRALPIDSEVASWFGRLGVLSINELARLPAASAAARLGEQAAQVLDLCQGRDDSPLVAYRVVDLLSEESSWDEPVDGNEPLGFVLRGLAARLSARLAGRGEAAQRLELVIEHDRSIARLRGAEPQTTLRFELASPLWRQAEISRVVAARLERLKLQAPSLGIRLSAPAVIRALGRQLDFSRVAGGLTSAPGVESLPVLLSELAADVGEKRVGVLQLADNHRPEGQSELSPVSPAPAVSVQTRRPGNARGPGKAGKGKPRVRKTQGPLQLPLRKVRPVRRPPQAPTRLLPTPLPLDVALRVGSTVRIEHRLYTIETVRFAERLDSVEWWSGALVARDYIEVVLRGTEGILQALVYVDRVSGRRYLQGIVD